MKQINKGQMIITSIITLLPMIVGIFFWNQLPDTIATHFGSNGEANGWSSKLVTVFGLPLFLLLVHFICVYGVANDPKRRGVSDKVFGLTMLICPICSVLCGWVIYGNALGLNTSITKEVGLVVGLILIVFGNYLPKSRRNYTVGIKLPWTLDDEDNWNKTHRLAGKIWMIGGVICILMLFFKFYSDVVMICIVLVISIIPAIYSFILYKMNNK